jgi:L-asparagine transporter-like permease
MNKKSTRRPQKTRKKNRTISLSWGGIIALTFLFFAILMLLFNKERHDKVLVAVTEEKDIQQLYTWFIRDKNAPGLGA